MSVFMWGCLGGNVLEVGALWAAVSQASVGITQSCLVRREEAGQERSKDGERGRGCQREQGSGTETWSEEEGEIWYFSFYLFCNWLSRLLWATFFLLSMQNI